MRIELDPRSLSVKSLETQKEEEGKDFIKVLKEAIEEVDRLQLEADQAIKELVVGKGDLTATVLALEKADLSFRLMMQIRNKLIRAYEEVMKMPL
jgi:flagellar hook-basal body complex protein FliE